MEKLIELLNEYENDISLWSSADWREFDWNLHYYSNYKDEYVFDNVYYKIISKNFWFIKWLLDNNKIRYEKVREQVDKEPMSIGRWLKYNILLMLLAISDTPIEDLISYLK